MRWLVDQILAAIQRRCKHPGMMIAADVLNGDAPDLRVQWCRRCGAIRIQWDEMEEAAEWSLPNPNLWSGRRDPNA